MSQEDKTADIYTQIGSDAPFYALVEHFYAGIETDALLRPLYPSDLTHAKAHLAWFFIQRFGGPTRYGEARGHPRLRMRHVPFRIGPQESAAWLANMARRSTPCRSWRPFALIWTAILRIRRRLWSTIPKCPLSLTE